MKYYPIKIVLIVFVLMISAAPSQASSKWRKAVDCADKNMQKKYYASAAEQYEHILSHQCSKDSIPADSVNSIKVKLGNCYMKMGNTIKAESNYGDAVRSGKADALTIFSYARSLESNSKYAEAQEQFDKVANNTAVKGKMAKEFSELSAKAVHADHNNNFGIQRQPFNTNAAEYAPAFYQKGLTFTSNRSERGAANHTTMWNKQAFTDIYTVQEDNKGDLNVIDRLPAPINSNLNDGAATFNSSFDEIFFTRNNKVTKEQDHLLIYTSTFNGAEWSDPVILNFEFDGANYSHPALAPDGNTLYFSSDVAGSGYGGMDIYVAHRNSPNSWGPPVNLGPNINTSGNEVFPFVAGDSTLYFASDGWPGYGGLDIFHAKIDQEFFDKKFGKAQNMGFNFNSAKDDFGLIVDSKNHLGYFSSNRDGDDDIYSFRLPVRKEEKKPEALRSMKLVDKTTGEPIAGARIEIADPRNPAEGAFYYTNENGVFYYDKKIKADEDVKVVKDKYKTNTLKGATIADKNTFDMALEQEKTEAKDESSLFTTILYYDVNTSSLVATSRDSLREVLELMKNPKNVVYVSGYADQRGSDTYNNKLSLQRVKEVIDFLTANGIETIRIRSAYFGAIKLDKDCIKDPKCVEETNRRNRRVEIKVGLQ